MNQTQSVRDRIEGGFERWGHFIIRWRWPAVALTLALTGYLISWLPQIQLDNSVESFLKPDDPAAVLYNDFRDQFAREDRILLAIESPDIFTLAFFEKLRALHEELEHELPYVEEITSLLNARSTRGEGDELIVGDLVDEFPRSQADVEQIRRRVKANPLYENALIGRDGTLTIVSIKPFTYSTLGEGEDLAGFDEDANETGAVYLTAAENDELLAALRRTTDKHGAEDFPIHLGGVLVLTDTINHYMKTDLMLFMALGIVLVFLLLFALFRRISGALMPLVVCMLSLLTTLGIMVMLQIPGSMAVQMLPLFLLTVGVCNSVHIVAIIYQQLAIGRDKEQAIVFALGHSGLAVVMTSLTTAAGMMSFVTAGLAPVAHLGTMAPAGIMLALVYTLVLLPALLAIFPLRPPRNLSTNPRGSPLIRILVACGDFSSRNPWKIVAAFLVIFALSAGGISKVRFSHNGLEWFPDGAPLREAFSTIDAGLEGSVSLEIVLDTGRENGLHEPQVLRRIDAAMRYSEALDFPGAPVGKAISIVDVVKETHQALNENRPDQRRIPDDRRLIAQELLLFENGGADDLQELVDTEFSRARITMTVPWVNAMIYPDLMAELRSGLGEIFGDEIEFEMTGVMALLATTFTEMIYSMLRSYVFALAVITPMMMLLLGSLRMGLLSMIPNLLPVAFTMGMMGWLDVPVDISTIMIGAMVIGLAVDDTIHFMHKFERYFSSSGDARLAVRETLTTTGAALLFTTLVLAAGFGILSLAYMENVARLGLLMALATVVAFLSDVLLGPALMVIVARQGRWLRR